MQHRVPPPSAPPAATHLLAAVPSEHLLALVRDRREDALAELYDRYCKLSYALALRVLRDRHLAEDAVQEGFLAVWRGASGFSDERGSARAWILTLVHRRAVDRVRREQRHDEAGSLPRERAAAPENVPALDLLGVRKALKRLAPGERRMVVLAYYEGLTQAQIADVLGVPIGTVKSGTARALARLASALRDSRVAAEPACSGA